MSFGWRKMKHALTRTCSKCREYGISYTIRKMRARAHGRELDRRLAEREVCFEETVIPFPGETAEEERAERSKPFSVAVQIHLFYEDLLEEFVGYLKRIAFEFDLFLSCREESEVQRIREYVRNNLPYVRQLVVKPVRNQGRDMAPFYVVFGDALKQYDYIMHAHSKKSLFWGAEQNGWRQQEMETLLPEKRPVSSILALMEREQIGLYFADTPEQLPRYSHTWLGNARRGKAFLGTLGIVPDREVFNYPTGSFFWARGKAVRRLFDAGLVLQDFEEEAGQSDGTLAHVLERAISFVVWEAGFHLGIYDGAQDVVRLDTSYRLLAPYFAQTRETMLERLLDYEVISFDLFGTLLEGGKAREDFLWIFRQLKERGRRLNIVADTELNREQVEQLLAENGYEGIAEFYLSGATGRSKEDGSLWEDYAKRYHRALCIHVGSHPGGDVRQPAIRMIEPFWILTEEETGKICVKK